MKPLRLPLKTPTWAQPILDILLVAFVIITLPIMLPYNIGRWLWRDTFGK